MFRYLTLRFEPALADERGDLELLSDGQKSLLYISLVLALHSLGRAVLAGTSTAFDVDKLRPAAFTIVAIEEPENSLAPHYLGRINKALHILTSEDDAQAIVATHAPSMLRRIKPEQVRYLRLDADRCTTVRHVLMPEDDADAAKFIREAVTAFPELYFARLVILGEGDSEEVVLPRLLSASDIEDDYVSIAVVPLGGRHVNHMWRLLRGLDIPHLTLLDLDLARFGGGWGRVVYAIKQLRAYSPAIHAEVTEGALANLPNWDSDEKLLKAGSNGRDWIDWLENHAVFFSAPLDLDLAMLMAFPAAYGIDDVTALAQPEESVVGAVLGRRRHGEGRYGTSLPYFTRYHDLFQARQQTSCSPGRVVAAHRCRAHGLHAAVRRPPRGARQDDSERAPRVISAESWLPAAGMTLEPNADIAVREVGRSVALTAGPGAGKTELLAQRADFLFRTGACPYPKRILAISFKVDAAHNLRERVARRCGVEYAFRFDSNTFHAFAKRLIDRYRPVLTGIDALDPDYTVGAQRAQQTIITFNDFVPLALTIATSSDIARNAIRQTYSHAFLDEFQDCTEEQYGLVRALFVDTPALLTAVGDTKQRIMAWAGALEGIFLKFQSDFDSLALNLYQNFRSEPALRRMQNRMIAVMEPAAAMDPAEIPGEDGTIDVLNFADDEQEANHVSTLIQELLGESVPPNEIGVLVAKQPNLIAATLIERLKAVGIPVRNEQDLQDLTAEPISNIVLDVLRVVLDSHQPAAYHRLMALAERSGVDDGYADRLRLRIDRCITSTRSQHAAAAIDLSDTDVLRAVIDDFLKVFGYEAIAALSHDYNDERRLNERIDTLLDRFAAEIDRGIESVAALDLLSGEDAISVLTIHKSKGLEFDTVILLGIEQETFWGNLDQERCVFFVGISRAKSRLVLTTAATRPSPPSAPWNWKVQRRPHAEFLSYVAE